MDRDTIKQAQSALDPQGPSQPTLDTAYETAGNAVDKEPAEQVASDANATQNGGAAVEKRVPSQQSSFVAPSLSTPSD
jgi:hypothetical protein